MSWLRPWSQEPWTVAYIGDSLTNGTSGLPTHRYEVERAFRRLAPGRRTVRTVGSNISTFTVVTDVPTQFESAHDGTSGWSAASAASAAAAIVSGWSTTPDIVIIHLGTNVSADADTYQSDIETLVAALPGTCTVVAVKVPPPPDDHTDTTLDGKYVAQNARLDLIDGIDIVVDAYTGYPPGEWQDYPGGDNVHLTTTGAAFVAERIIAALAGVAGLESLS